VRYEKCGVLHFGGSNFCVQRLACRAISASAKLLVLTLLKRVADGCLPPPPLVCRSGDEYFFDLSASWFRCRHVGHSASWPATWHSLQQLTLSCLATRRAGALFYGSVDQQTHKPGSVYLIFQAVYEYLIYRKWDKGTWATDMPEQWRRNKIWRNLQNSPTRYAYTYLSILSMYSAPRTTRIGVFTSRRWSIFVTHFIHYMRCPPERRNRPCKASYLGHVGPTRWVSCSSCT